MSDRVPRRTPHRKPDRAAARPEGDRRRQLGDAGEELAAAHLRRGGYRILARNVRAGGVEIDLVVRRGQRCVFVEVKTRRGRGFGLPEDAVDARKRARLLRGGASWLRDHGWPGARVRFDVVCVEPGADGELHVRHLPGAFDAGDV